jgi:hypothetical protein
LELEEGPSQPISNEGVSVMPELEPVAGEPKPDPILGPDREPAADPQPVVAVERNPRRKRRRYRLGLAGLAAAAVVVGGLFASGLLAPPHHSALAAGRTSAATPCPPPPTISAEQLQQAQQRFAQQLAQALGKPESAVESALVQLQQRLPKPPAGAQAQTVRVGPDPAVLAAVATQLGVTLQELADAMTAAGPPLPGCPSSPGQGGAVAVKVDATQLFDRIAQQLGHGLTGTQVQAAFERVKSTGAVTFHAQAGASVSFAPSGPDDPLATLATALEVTTDQLKAALQAIATSSGCPAPPPGDGTGTAGAQGGGLTVSAGGSPDVMFCLSTKP